MQGGTAYPPPRASSGANIPQRRPRKHQQQHPPQPSRGATPRSQTTSATVLRPHLRRQPRLTPPSSTTVPCGFTVANPALNFSVEAMTPEAVPWHRLKQAPPLLLPAVALSAQYTTRSIVQQGLIHGGDVSPRPSRGLVRGGGIPLPLPPASLVRGDIPHGRPLGLVRGGDDPRGRLVTSSAPAGRAFPPRSSSVATSLTAVRGPRRR